MSVRTMRLLTEGYIKNNVDFNLFFSLNEGSKERFKKKMVIELCRQYSPKASYGISKGEVDEIFVDIFNRLLEGFYVNLKEDKYYVYKNPVNQYRMVKAKSKKETLEIASLISWKRLSDAIRTKNSIKRVAKVNRENVITEDGETCELDPFLHTINICETEAPEYE